MTHYHLSFANHLTVDTANHLRSRIVSIIERADFEALTLLLALEGGSTDVATALYNFIRGLPVPIATHSMGHVGSAGIIVFLAGTQRSCVSGARFFFHEYDWGFDERQTLKRIDEAAQRLRDDIKLHGEIIKAETKAGNDLVGTLDGTTAPRILTPTEAEALGLVQSIGDLPKTGAGGIAVAVWT